MSQLLETCYASAPNGETPIFTLELKHSSFNVEGFPVGVIRLVQGYGGVGFSDLMLGLETGETVAFKPSAIGLSLPEPGVRGRQDLVFQLDNVSGQALKAIDEALETSGEVETILRIYVASDLTYPNKTPLRMIATECEGDLKSVSVSASFHDLVNKAWPTKRYTSTFAPGLKYFG